MFASQAMNAVVAARSATSVVRCAIRDVRCRAIRVPTPIRSLASASVTPGSAAAATRHRAAASSSSSTTTVDDSKSKSLFSASTSISPQTRQVIARRFGFDEMTPVQAKVLAELPTKTDLLVRAKTGTGKTLAFLVAAIEHVKAKHKDQAFRTQGPAIIVMAPTRDIALQITQEAQKLCADQGIYVTSAVGGTPYNQHILARANIGVLVCTPGRLKDLLERGIASIDSRVRSTDVFILDEADRLLDMGFERDIRSIMGYLSPERATYMFSATFSREVISIASSILAPGFKHLDTISESEVPVQKLVKQTYAIVPIESSLTHLYEVLLREKKENPTGYKVIVFFNSINMCTFMHDMLATTSEFRSDIFTLHSRQTQAMRTRVGQEFRHCKTGILITTDVSARGVDYPNVSLVVNYGIPSSFDSYVHRIGRSGRAGKQGKAMTLLSPHEKYFVDVLHRNNIPVSADALDGSQDLSSSTGSTALDASTMPLDLRKIVLGSLIGSNLQAFAGANINVDTMLRHTFEFAVKVLKIPNPTLSSKIARSINSSNLHGFTVERFSSTGDRPRPSTFGNSGNFNKDFANRAPSRGSFGSRDGSFGSRDSSRDGTRDGGYARRDSSYSGRRDMNYASREYDSRESKGSLRYTPRRDSGTGFSRDNRSDLFM